jgi:hypothetical protein
MTAVDLQRLRDQINNLTWKITRPEEFHTAINDLFEFYADRVYRPGKAAPTARLISAYHISPLVLRQLNLDLPAHCNENPAAALAVADHLWQDPFLETRCLATMILGMVPLNPPEVVLERLKNWCIPEEEISALKSLLARGSERLRHETPELWLNVIRGWAERTQIEYRGLALLALQPFVEDQDFENLPPIYKILNPVLRDATSKIQREIEDLLVIFARRSAVETAFFLRQTLAMGCNSITMRIIRRVLPEFPAPLQTNLRNALLNAPTLPNQS